LAKRGFAFVSNAAEKEYKDLPDSVQDEFGKSLRYIQFGYDPLLPVKNIGSSVGAGAIELIINGSPAFRCVYIVKYADTVFVLHSFTKTTNIVDRPAMEVAKKRLNELKKELTKNGVKI